LVQGLLRFALGGEAPDNIVLQAIRDAPDRAGCSVKTALNISIEPAPWKVFWESISGDPRPDPLGQRDGAATNALAAAVTGGKQRLVASCTTTVRDR
jgi:hypothetical protein